MRSSSYISIDPVISIQTVDPYRTSPQSWTNDTVKSSYGNSGANPPGYDYPLTVNSDNLGSYSNNTFRPIQPYHERLDYRQYSLDNNISHPSYINKLEFAQYDGTKEKMSYWHQLDQKDYLGASESMNLSGRRPFEDITNRPTNYALSSQNDFQSCAIKMEPSYRGEENKALTERLVRREDVKDNEAPSMMPEQFFIKEVDMAYYSRPIVFNIKLEQNRSVSYFSELYQTAEPMVGLDARNELKVNHIMGKKKGKSVYLIRRNKPGLDIDTSYNNNAHILVISADDGVADFGISFKNLMHDSYATRTGYMEVKRW